MASPVSHVWPGAPPFLIMHGTADHAVPLAQSQSLADALAVAGAAVETVGSAASDHMWIGAPDIEGIFAASVDFARRVTRSEGASRSQGGAVTAGAADRPGGGGAGDPERDGPVLHWHTADMHRECVDLFALQTPGVRAEMMWGVYEGPEGIERLYPGWHMWMGEEAQDGQLHMHTLTTPVIEVAGDLKDRQGDLDLARPRDHVPAGGGRHRWGALGPGASTAVTSWSKTASGRSGTCTSTGSSSRHTSGLGHCLGTKPRRGPARLPGRAWPGPAADHPLDVRAGPGVREPAGAAGPVPDLRRVSGLLSGRINTIDQTNASGT